MQQNTDKNIRELLEGSGYDASRKLIVSKTMELIAGVSDDNVGRFIASAINAALKQPVSEEDLDKLAETAQLHSDCGDDFVPGYKEGFRAALSLAPVGYTKEQMDEAIGIIKAARKDVGLSDDGPIKEMWALEERIDKFLVSVEK